jgi:hypothetical protein
MVIPRLLLLSLLASSPVAPAFAQSVPTAPAEGADGTFQVPFTQPNLPMQFGTSVVKPSGAPESKVQSNLFQTPLAAKRFRLSPSNAVGVAQLIQPQLPSRMSIAPSGPSTCFAIRSYDFTRESPASDATRFSGSSTCRAASSAHLKAIAEPGSVLPR